MTKVEAADRVNLCILRAAGLNSTDLENLVKCLHPCPDMRRFMIVTKKLCMWLAEVVNANKQLSVSKKIMF